MTTTATSINIDELTTGAVTGTGVFDVMMATVKAHLEQEFKSNRIRGADFANVYVGSLTAVLGQSASYALARARLDAELEQLRVQTSLVQAQVDQIRGEIAKQPYEIALLEGQVSHQTAQTALVTKQHEHLIEQIKQTAAEVLVTGKRGTQIDAQTALTVAQTDQVEHEILRAPKQLELLTAQVANAEAQTQVSQAQLNQIQADVARTTQETANLVKQGTHLTAQTAHTEAQTNLVTLNATKVPLEIAGIEAQNLLTANQANKIAKDIALQEIKIDIDLQQLELARKELLLKGEQLELLKAQVASQHHQTELYAQKVVTERAQTNGTVIGSGSVLGMKNDLMGAQTDGFKRDAEQKITKLLVDSWAVRRSNDNGVKADSINKLDDATIGAVVTKALAGINVTPA